MFNRKSGRTLLSGMALLTVAASSAMAANVKWTFTNVVLTDSTAITGSFVYNADTQTFSSISIATQAGTSLGSTPASGGTFTVTAPGFTNLPVSATEVTFLTSGNPGLLNNTPAILLGFNPNTAALTDAGGTIDVSGSDVTTCSGGTCPALNAGVQADTRIVASGTIAGAAVAPPAAPAPALSPLAMVLAACGLVALGMFGLRKAQA